jgi:hypothetical protein
VEGSHPSGWDRAANGEANPAQTRGKRRVRGRKTSGVLLGRKAQGAGRGPVAREVCSCVVCVAEVGRRRFRPVKPRRVTSLIRRGPTGWPGTQLEACPSRRKARAGSARVKKRRAAAPSAVTSRSRDRRRIAKMRSPAGGRRLGPWKHRSFHEGDVEAVNGGPQGSRGGVRGSIGSTPRKRKRQARGRERPGRNRPIRRSVVGVVKRQ